MVYHIGCLHLGHENMAKHRGFNSAAEHDEYLIQEWNKVVEKRAKVFIHGDITMENKRHYYMLDQLKGLKHVILGNHDRPQDVQELMQYVNGISGMVDYNGFSLTHCPIHPNEVAFYRGNIHAHIHENKLHEVQISDRYDDKNAKVVNTVHKYINVDAKMIGYQPLAFESIIEMIKK